jgi:flagellar protein FlaI
VLCIQEQIYIEGKRVRRTRSLVEVLNVDPETGDLGINELFNWEPSGDCFIMVGDSHILQEIMNVRGWDSGQLRNEMENRRKILDYMYAKNIRNYVQVSIVVQAYQTHQKMVMEAVENDTLLDMIQSIAA